MGKLDQRRARPAAPWGPLPLLRRDPVSALILSFAVFMLTAVLAPAISEKPGDALSGPGDPAGCCHGLGLAGAAGHYLADLFPLDWARMWASA